MRSDSYNVGEMQFMHSIVKKDSKQMFESDHMSHTRVASLLLVDLHLVVGEVIGDHELAALVLVAVRDLSERESMRARERMSGRCEMGKQMKEKIKP